ncbi:phospholipase D-like domain-containing protein [Aquincola tertiaricarbonis]|uniref:Phospholipase D-like domain-containing protein n=1 Tax=Aquincola tertiaricarbonis TaxID=391953 RepID=A0ABY4SK97_AQUTE|nr:phospholipase D-like domain-containing protein [Aquincola tertiaricarbonis]URI11795.1 phospholipase D-like domain-containing protein [Aquincola tertiaricarbonis]
MLPVLTLAHWLSLHGLVTAIALLIYVITAHVLGQRRQPAAAVAWVLFILLLPYVALPAFLIFGSRKRARAVRLGGLHPAAQAPSWAEQTALALRQPAAAPYDDLAIHQDGQAARGALWEVIDQAQHSIELCTFIIGRDGFGQAVVERLAARARAGVTVRLMVDGLGALMGGRPELGALKAAGGHLVQFVPPLHSPLRGRTNLRNHRKLLIADAGHPTQRLWCGGRNLASEYFDGEPGKPAWHDLSFDLRGPLVLQAGALFRHDWRFAGGQPRLPAIPLKALPPPLPGEQPLPRAQLIASGPDQVDDTVQSMLVTAAYRARERLLMVTPYFVPDAALLGALCLAARRGVVVDLLLPARSNHGMSDIARGRALRTLAAAGARIWLTPHMLHAKLVVVDETLALAGSANIDSRSLFLNYELMVAFHDAAAVQAFAQWFEQERAQARRSQPARAGLLRDVGEGLVLWVGFQL